MNGLADELRSRMSTETPSKSELRNFELLLALAGMHTRNIVQSSMVTMASLAYFAADPEHKLFAWNPANMIPYLALKAFEDRAFVELAELIKDENKLLPAGVSLRRKEELRNHRDVLSHTSTIKWKRPALQAFFDAHKQWTDVRAAIVWDLWHSLNEAARDLGANVGSEEIGVAQVHVTMLHTILRYSLKPELVGVHLPNEEVLARHLMKFRDDFLAFLAKRPAG